MKVKFGALYDSFQYVASGGYGINHAYLNRQTGEIHWHSEMHDSLEELPDDIEDKEKYVAIPDKRELDLGKPVVFRFVSEFLPDDLDKVHDIFSRKGAYARFKYFLGRRRALDQWYAFSDKAEQEALRQWCADNGIELED